MGQEQRTNPYVDLLVTSLPDEVEVNWFSWRRALLTRYDAFHLHWPEALAGAQRPAWIRILLVLALVVRLKVFRTPIIRTVHNITPHDAGDRASAALLNLLDRVTSFRVVMNPQHLARFDGNTRLIPHGHYRSAYPLCQNVAPLDGHLLVFGQLRPYKRIESVLNAFRDVPDPAWRLTVAGAAPDNAYLLQLREIAAADPRISIQAEAVDVSKIGELFARHSLVVLPYGEDGNSGAALLALSLARPVLLPASEASTLLSDEVGEGWVRVFTPPLDGSALVHAMRKHAHPSSEPDLSGRDWDRIAAQHLQVYEAARSVRRDRLSWSKRRPAKP